MPQGELEALETRTRSISWPTSMTSSATAWSCRPGAIRNHKPEIMYKAFAIAGYSQEQVDANFSGMINAFKFGAPPHGGSAPGIDRIVMLLADEPNIREVVLFPMNQRAEDLMMQAPAPATPKQLRELSIRVVDAPKAVGRLSSPSLLLTRLCRAASSEVEMRPSRHGTQRPVSRLRSRLRSNSARHERCGGWAGGRGLSFGLNRSRVGPRVDQERGMTIKLADYEAGRKYAGDYDADLCAVQERLARIQVAHIVHKRRAIIVFEGWDAAGKGGAIQRLTAEWDPRNYQVWPIAAPSRRRSGGTFLWRFWTKLPAMARSRCSIAAGTGACSSSGWRASRPPSSGSAAMTRSTSSNRSSARTAPRS
jgi:hypothetical protein